MPQLLSSHVTNLYLPPVFPHCQDAFLLWQASEVWGPARSEGLQKNCTNDPGPGTVVFLSVVMRISQSRNRYAIAAGG
jgi:hypothetical protein